MTLPSSGWIAESLIGLCQAYELEGVECDPHAVDLPRQLTERIGVLEFHGSGLSGTIALSLPPAPLRSMWPGGPNDANLLADWLGELTNQLMGRLNHRFLAHGLTVAVGTPRVLSSSVTLARGRHGYRWSSFRTRDGSPIVVGLELHWSDDGIIATKGSTSSEVPAAAGEIILF